MSNFGPVQALRRLFKWGPQVRGPQDIARPKSKRTRQSPYDMYRDTMRLPRDRAKTYDSYDELDEISEIASVLDAYAEDATQHDKERKASVWVEGPDAKIVAELNMLFQRLEIEQWIEGLARDLAKNGDDFARLRFFDPVRDPDRSRYGIVGIEWVDPRTIERVEDEDGLLLGFMDTAKVGGTQIKAEDLFMPWEFVHWRIRTRKYISKQGSNIYGTSLLRNASRAGKQMKMIDDMLMILRMTKSTDKRIYNIDVGAAAPAEIPSILREYQAIFTRAHWRDLLSDDVSQMYDPLAIDEDIFWPKRSGSETEVKVIPSEPNINNLADVDHKRNQLFGALRAPKMYFGYDDSGQQDARTSVSSQDIRFARITKKLQGAIKLGLSRLAQIHLAFRGMDTNADNFNIMMTEPSSLEHVQRLESMQVLIDIGERMVVMGTSMALDPVSWRTHILRKVFSFSEEEIKKYFHAELVTNAAPELMMPASSEDPQAALPPDPNQPPQNPPERLMNALKKADPKVFEVAMKRAIAKKLLAEPVTREKDPRVEESALPVMAVDIRTRKPKALDTREQPDQITVGNVVYKWVEDVGYQSVGLVVESATDSGTDEEDDD